MSEEITAEFSREELTAHAPPLRVIPRVTVACKTDLGRVRENNEDKFEFFLPEDRVLLATRGLVFVVCDGMGGHSAGQIASELACKTFIDVYLRHSSEDPEEALRFAVEATNRFVCDVGRQVPGRAGMGTTLVALCLVQDKAFVVNVGDSRAYRYRRGELLRLTHDHTLAEEYVRSGMLSPEEVARHPYSHVLSRCIGVEEKVVPDIFVHDVEVNDVYLLCSDGLTGHVGDEEIAQALSLPPSEAAWRLVAQALVAGGTDNCTVLIVRVDSLSPSEDFAV
jgi:serine/threonine protein phosphatase PrpC